jgi:hypothetical protein
MVADAAQGVGNFLRAQNKPAFFNSHYFARERILVS